MLKIQISSEDHEKMLISSNDPGKKSGLHQRNEKLQKKMQIFPNNF